MALTVNINLELEERLAARARSHGQSLQDFIQHLLEDEAAASPEPNAPRPLTGSEKAAAFEAWAKSFPPNLPVLSLRSVSRENIYQRD